MRLGASLRAIRDKLGDVGAITFPPLGTFAGFAEKSLVPELSTKAIEIGVNAYTYGEISMVSLPIVGGALAIRSAISNWRLRKTQANKFETIERNLEVSELRTRAILGAILRHRGAIQKLETAISAQQKQIQLLGDFARSQQIIIRKLENYSIFGLIILGALLYTLLVNMLFEVIFAEQYMFSVTRSFVYLAYGILAMLGVLGLFAEKSGDR